MTVYLDLVLLLNFAVDLLLLLGTNRLSGFPAGAGRCAIASALGAGYGAACLLPGFSFLGSFLWRGVFLLLMGVLAFGWNRSAWKRTGVFVLLTMAMGGIAMSMGTQEFPALMLGALVIWLLCRVGFGSQVGGREYIPVTVTEGNRSTGVLALKDTGNALRDPITGEQVLILGPAAAESLLDLSPGELKNPMQTLVENPGKGFRLIPYQTVGHPGGLLLARRFENVKLGERTGRAIIAFSPETIGSGEVYQALAGGML